MAGRRPRQPRDAKIYPLNGRPVPPPPPRNPYVPMPSPARIKALADSILLRTLEDPAMPDHLRSPAFRPSVEAWARTEAGLKMIYDWMSDQIEAGGVGAMMLPPLPGTRPPIEVWMSMENRAASLRSKLGLDPVSYAKIARDLGLARRSEEDALERMAKAGAEITARRELESGDDDDVPEGEIVPEDGEPEDDGGV